VDEVKLSFFYQETPSWCQAEHREFSLIQIMTMTCLSQPLLQEVDATMFSRKTLFQKYHEFIPLWSSNQ